MDFLKRLLVLSALVAGIFLFSTVTAQAQQATMTDAHIQRIVSSCVQANRALTQLHASDALLRVNRGQLYDLISTRLMARLNSRLSLNRLDGSKLVSVAAAFDTSLNAFRLRYQVYEEQLSSTIKIDCTKQPVAFYDAVGKARELRSSVHDAVLDLSRYTNEYGQEFDAFREEFLRQQTKGNKT